MKDQTHLYAISDLLPGIPATVSGEILRTEVNFGRRKMMTCQISDGSGILTLRFFNFTAAMKKITLLRVKQVIAYGEIKRGSRGPEIIHPEYKIKVAGSEVKLQETLTPIYSTTEGLRQTSLRKINRTSLNLT